MSKLSVILPAQRAALMAIKARRVANGLIWRFGQADAVKAIAEAAKAWADAIGERQLEIEEFEPYKENPNPPPPLTWRGFEALGEGGFLGNASQFRQVLEKLDPSDDLWLVPSASASDY
jgi:hypothetical protein